MFATSREGGVIGRLEIESHQRKHGAQKALCLTQWQLESQAQRQRSFDCMIGVLLLRTTPACGCWFPGDDGII
jgi:hypothetical protein